MTLAVIPSEAAHREATTVSLVSFASFASFAIQALPSGVALTG